MRSPTSAVCSERVAVDHQHAAVTGLRQHRLQQRVVLEAPHGADRPGELSVGRRTGRSCRSQLRTSGPMSSTRSAVAAESPSRGYSSPRAAQLANQQNRQQADGDRHRKRHRDRPGSGTATRAGCERLSSARSTVDFACAAASLAPSDVIVPPLVAGQRRSGWRGRTPRRPAAFLARCLLRRGFLGGRLLRRGLLRCLGGRLLRRRRRGWGGLGSFVRKFLLVGHVAAPLQWF